MGRKCPVPVKITTGNRLTWHRGDAFYVNPNRRKNGNIDQGWPDIVHLLSHYVHARKYPGHKPHDGRGTHAFVERSMIQYVVESGWLEGKLKRAERPAKPAPTVEERAAVKLQKPHRSHQAVGEQATARRDGAHQAQPSAEAIGAIASCLKQCCARQRARLFCASRSPAGVGPAWLAVLARGTLSCGLVAGIHFKSL
jgi:hypothetical protein